MKIQAAICAAALLFCGCGKCKCGRESTAKESEINLKLKTARGLADLRMKEADVLYRRAREMMAPSTETLPDYNRRLALYGSAKVERLDAELKARTEKQAREMNEKARHLEMMAYQELAVALQQLDLEKNSKQNQ